MDGLLLRMLLAADGCCRIGRLLALLITPAVEVASVFGVLVLGLSELGVSFVLCFIFRAVGFRVLCWVLGSS